MKDQSNFHDWDRSSFRPLCVLSIQSACFASCHFDGARRHCKGLEHLCLLSNEHLLIRFLESRAKIQPAIPYVSTASQGVNKARLERSVAKPSPGFILNRTPSFAIPMLVFCR